MEGRGAVVIEGGLGGVLPSSEGWIAEGPASSEGWIAEGPASSEGWVEGLKGVRPAEEEEVEWQE